MIQNDITACSNLEKAQLFGSNVEKIFSNEDIATFDVETRKKVDDFLHQKKDNIFTTRNGDEYFDSEFSFDELEDAIGSLKKKSASGNDGIKNLNLINLSFLGKSHCLRIFNKSWQTGKLITDWKTAEITMIRKKTMIFLTRAN